MSLPEGVVQGRLVDKSVLKLNEAKETSHISVKMALQKYNPRWGFHQVDSLCLLPTEWCAR